MFEISNTLSFNKDKLVDGNRYDYVTRTSLNQGILRTTGFVNEKNINPSGTWSLGLLQMDFFYRKKPWYAGQFIRIISSKINIPLRAIPFITTILNLQKKVLLSVLVRNVDKTFNELMVNLPTKNGEIDFEFMESFVAELEAQRVAELEAYLLATGLKDYELTKYDKDILDRFDKLYDNRLEKNTDKIRLEDILDWQVGIKEIDPLKLNLLYQEGKKYPFYGQATENNGIINYVSLKKEVLNNKNSYPTILIHSNNQNIVYLDTPFYLKDGHGATSVLQNKNMTYKSALYFMGAIKKVIKERFDYNSKATKIGLKNTIIELPIDDKIVDYKFMEDFITVVQKLVIKDVVLYADRKIEATRQVIER